MHIGNHWIRINQILLAFCMVWSWSYNHWSWSNYMNAWDCGCWQSKFVNLFVWNYVLFFCLWSKWTSCKLFEDLWKLQRGWRQLCANDGAELSKMLMFMKLYILMLTKIMVSTMNIHFPWYYVTYLADTK